MQEDFPEICIMQPTEHNVESLRRYFSALNIAECVYGMCLIAGYVPPCTGSY